MTIYITPEGNLVPLTAVEAARLKQIHRMANQVRRHVISQGVTLAAIPKVYAPEGGAQEVAV